MVEAVVVGAGVGSAVVEAWVWLGAELSVGPLEELGELEEVEELDDD